jgi:hypothetical protein
MKKLFYVVSMVFTLSIVSGTFSRAEAQTKHTWSKKKKNTVIGAGVGAATGAVVSKHHVKGAVVGGAVGAGAGYLWGRHKEKKAARK